MAMSAGFMSYPYTNKVTWNDPVGIRVPVQELFASIDLFLTAACSTVCQILPVAKTAASTPGRGSSVRRPTDKTSRLEAV